MNRLHLIEGRADGQLTARNKSGLYSICVQWLGLSQFEPGGYEFTPGPPHQHLGSRQTRHIQEQEAGIGNKARTRIQVCWHEMQTSQATPSVSALNAHHLSSPFFLGLESAVFIVIYLH